MPIRSRSATGSRTVVETCAPSFGCRSRRAGSAIVVGVMFLCVAPPDRGSGPEPAVCGVAAVRRGVLGHRPLVHFTAPPGLGPARLDQLAEALQVRMDATIVEAEGRTRLLDDPGGV